MSDQEVVVIPPEAVEQQMVEKALAEDPTGLPVDKAAAFFGKHVEVLEHLLNGMSNRAMKRMIMHTATKNLNKDYTLKKGTDEERAAYHFEEVVFTRMIMQLHVEAEKAAKAQELENEQKQLSLIKGETNEQTSDQKENS